MGASVSASASTSRRGRPTRRAMSEINVTPLVDVMLVLLIIFMVTAPMLTAGVTVDLPDSKASPLPGKDEPLSVSIKSDGSIYIQETKVTRESLAARLKAIAGANAESRIFVRADRSLDYGTVMKVVGEINAGGFTKVALVTDIETR